MACMLESLLNDYGHPILLLGTLLEGETILILGAAIWVVAISLAGFYFGQTVEIVLGDIKRYEIEVLVFVSVAGLLVWGVFLFRRRKARQQNGS